MQDLQTTSAVTLGKVTDALPGQEGVPRLDHAGVHAKLVTAPIGVGVKDTLVHLKNLLLIRHHSHTVTIDETYIFTGVEITQGLKICVLY